MKALVSALIVLPLGFYAKYYGGPGADWVNNGLAGSFYVLFWCLVVSGLRPRSRPGAVAALVLAATCALEFLQLWNAPPLEWVRATFLGRALIGSDFAWLDFPFYFLGAAAGWFWLRRLKIEPRRG